MSQGSFVTGALLPIAFTSLVIALLLWRSAKSEHRQTTATNNAFNAHAERAVTHVSQALASRNIWVNPDSVFIERDQDGKLTWKVVEVRFLVAYGTYSPDGTVYVQSYPCPEGETVRAFSFRAG